MTTPTTWAAANLAMFGPPREQAWTREQLGALEIDGGDPVLDAAFYPDHYGDIAAAEAEDRYERQAERALEFAEWGAR